MGMLVIGSYLAGLSGLFTDNEPKLCERGFILPFKRLARAAAVGVVGCGVDLRLKWRPLNKVKTPLRLRNSLIILTVGVLVAF